MPGQIPIKTDFQPVGGGTPFTSITGGDPFDLEVVLDSATSVDLDVVVRANSNKVSIHGSGLAFTLTVPAGDDRASTTVSTNSVTSNTTVHFSATANSTTVGADLTLTP